MSKTGLFFIVLGFVIIGLREFTDAITCRSCIAGSYLTNCTDLSLGICVQCSTGTYTPDASQATTCRMCGPGTEVNALRSGCIACAAAKYKNGSSTESCKACETCGTRMFRNGCTAASSGGNCSLCPLGTYKTSVSTAPCTLCGVSKTTIAEGATVCTDCVPGMYVPATKPPNCLQCPMGKYSTMATVTTCSACPVGKYGPTTGMNTCTFCPTGTYTATHGLTACTQCTTTCGPNQYLSGTCSGSQNPTCKSCSPCVAGQYTTGVCNSTGNTECQTCPRDNYCVPSSLEPIPCPENSSSEAGAASESHCVCKFGFDKIQ